MTNTSNTTQRDEMALDIFLADNGSIPESDLRQDWADAPNQHRPYAQNIADGLIAKGYRELRTTTTVEELDALPCGRVILDADQVACQRMEPSWLWEAGGEIVPTSLIPTPVSVLHEPVPEVTR